MFTTEKNAVIQKTTENGLPYVAIEGVREFDVSKTFDCGQCFRFEPVENTPYESEFAGVAYGRFISVARDKEDLLIFNCTKEFFEEKLRHFLGLDLDYENIRRTLTESTDSSYLRAAAESAKGIRILNQNRWETICSFIISQNNNIPRIMGIIERLCENFGTKIGDDYAFPTLSQLKGVTAEDLSVLRAGFRNKYIVDAVEKIASGEVDLGAIYDMPIENARQELIKIKGVGAKVAECTLLYGFGRVEAFPVDVWVKRIMAELYENGLPECTKNYEGIAQQYLFHWRRNLK